MRHGHCISILLAALAVTYVSARSEEVLTVKTDTLEIVFDSEGHGGIRSLTVGKKVLVRDNALPPLFGTLLESKSFDNFRDFVSDAVFVDGKYQRLTFDSKKDGDTTIVTSTGKLVFGADAINAHIVWTIRNGSPVIETSVQLSLEGAFANRYIRELGVQLPTVCDVRKRVVQGGDQGWQFDTRRSYQFHLDTTGHLMPEPEHNYWNLFMVEQDSPQHFRAWRAESHATPPQVIQHGHQAAGWIAEYDAGGGLLFAYPDLAKLAPKALFLNASAGGAPQVLFHASAWKALPPNSAAAKSQLWEPAHRIDWIPFEGAFATVKPQAALAKAWGVEKLPSDSPATPKLLDLDIVNAPAAMGAGVPMVTGGLPIPRGALTQANGARLWKKDHEVPVQSRALAYWPDQSIKWLLLTFPLNGNGYAAVTEHKGTLLPFPGHPARKRQRRIRA